VITRFQALPNDVYQYLLDASGREPPVLTRLRAATVGTPYWQIQIAPEQAQFLTLLVKLTNARRCIELGTFNGYSTLAIALALPPDGTLITCDIQDHGARLGRKFWVQAGVESRIDMRVQPALTTLNQLLEQGAAGTFDFAFIDADKENQIDYYEKILQLLRPGGLIAVDNTLAAGVPVNRGEEAFLVATRQFNEHVHKDERVDLAMIPIGEGVTLLRKRT